jgi:RNA polymerase sigma factor (sigma-70 family)
MLWRIAAMYEADPERRRDLHQEMLVAVWRAAASFRGEAKLRTFLARVAHNRGVSHVAREAARPRTAPLDPETPSAEATPYEAAEETERQARLMAAVRRLPLAWGQAVALTLEGFSPREIAEVLGVGANVVSIRLTRAKAALRASLEVPS